MMVMMSTTTTAPTTMSDDYQITSRFAIEALQQRQQYQTQTIKHITRIACLRQHFFAFEDCCDQVRAVSDRW